MPKKTAAASRGGRNGKLDDPRGPRTGRRTNRADGGHVTKVAREEAGLVAAEAPHRGAAALTEGLDPFDRERASSLADEGGTAGATVEARPPSDGPPPPGSCGSPRRAASRGWPPCT